MGRGVHRVLLGYGLAVRDAVGGRDHHGRMPETQGRMQKGKVVAVEAVPRRPARVIQAGKIPAVEKTACVNLSRPGPGARRG